MPAVETKNVYHDVMTLQSAAVANGNGGLMLLRQGGIVFEVFGTIAGGTKVAFEFSVAETPAHGGTWYALRCENMVTGDVDVTQATATGTAFRADVSNVRAVRARVFDYGGADSVTVVATASPLVPKANSAIAIASGEEIALTASTSGGTVLLLVTTAEAALASQACREVLLQAHPDNTEDVRWTLTASGASHIMTPGATATLQVSNADQIRVKTDQNTANLIYSHRN